MLTVVAIYGFVVLVRRGIGEEEDEAELELRRVLARIAELKAQADRAPAVQEAKSNLETLTKEVALLQKKAERSDAGRPGSRVRRALVLLGVLPLLFGASYLIGRIDLRWGIAAIVLSSLLLALSEV